MASGGSKTPIVIVAMALVAILVAGATFFYVNRNNSASAGEVFLEPADQPGQNPFSTSVKVDSISITTTAIGGRVATVKEQPTTPEATSRAGSSATTSATAAPTSSTAPGGTQVASRTGSAPGLYGGTQNIGRCDPAQLVSFLQSNPDKANAWVQALNSDTSLQWSGGNKVTTTQIAVYVAELTPLTLTADTRVTNYGFANGQPTSRHAVLQAGTAVLVDKYGVPRTKCACGNPLTKPTPVPMAPVYQGTPWRGWNPQNVIIVQQTNVVINNFTIVNFNGPGYLERPSGTTGRSDTPSTYTDNIPESYPSTTDSSRRSSSTTERSPSTTERSTSTTRQSTTSLSKSDYCQIARDIQARFAGSAAVNDASLQAIVDALQQLADAAPGELKADWATLLSYWRKWIKAQDRTAAPPPEYNAAEKRVEQHLKDYCGITTPTSTR